MKNSTGKKLYSMGEAYRNLYRALRTIPYGKQAKQSGLLSDAFKERIMLAVTEVNGCAMCSYAHTQAALATGMSTDAIRLILAGEFAEVPSEELLAILFAQHYADSRGRPSAEAWAEVQKKYGGTQSIAILSTVQIIMAGNTYGIPLGSFKARFKPNEKNRIDTRSSLSYELTMLLSITVFLPIALLHTVWASLLHQSLLDI